MIETFAILYFSQVIGEKAKSKGYSKKWNIFSFIFIWILFEILGGIIGQILVEGLWVYFFALIGAGVGGAFHILL